MSGFGVFSVAGTPPRLGWRDGDEVVDLSALGGAFAQRSLNALMAKGPEVWAAALDTARAHDGPRVPLADATLHLPFEVGDYVDFNSSLEHATNLGRILRPDDEPVRPNWRRMPIAYHGRAGSIAVSGTDVTRPRGQRLEPGTDVPVFAPTRRLDIELELGFVVGVPSRRGEPIPTERFAEHVFGVVLVNDWSARDIQAWEYVPLGPFLGKSFLTSVSAWVTPLALLEERRVQAPAVSRRWTRLGAGPRPGGRAQRRRRLARQRAHVVLDDAATARARDVQRRSRADRRSDGLGNDLRWGARHRGLAHRTGARVPGGRRRGRTARPRRRSRARRGAWPGASRVATRDAPDPQQALLVAGREARDAHSELELADEGRDGERGEDEAAENPDAMHELTSSRC
jgi:2-keto-4-pentenoate hydratase/2-oxohepta-3-ene-1,7-dioic acid hydratase in catechol pathway